MDAMREKSRGEPRDFSRRLKHGLRPAKLRFLQGEPGASGNEWKHFLKELDVAVQSSADIAAACQGACDAFDALLALTRRRPPRGPAAGVNA
jgi:heme oxygenase